jgi:hypothetical protein
MILSDAIAGLALMMALLALWQSSRANRAQQASSAWLTHLAEIVEVESRLGSLPEALRFHGLAKEDLDQAGLTPQEFAYLLNSFTLGGTWDRILHPNLRTPFGVDSYRYRMCKSKQTRRAWPLVKKLLNPSDFVARVELTIKQIEEEERGSGRSIAQQS